MNTENTYEYGEAPVARLAPRRQERILELTMKKIEEQRAERHRPVRRLIPLLAAALTVAALSLTAFAAYENGWFGFDRLFGGKAELVEPDVMHYTMTAPDTEAADAPSEPAADAAGTELPAAAPAAEQPEGLQFTLESLLAGRDTLLAVVRAEAVSEAGRTELERSSGENRNPEQGGFYLLAECFPAEGGGSEAVNGGMSMRRLSLETGVAYYLLTNTGGRFSLGDRVRIHMMDGGRGRDLCWVTIERLMETERSLALDASVYAGKGYYYDRLTVTPVGLRVSGEYDPAAGGSVCPDVTLELKDGTSFSLAGPENGYHNAPYGSFGALSYSFAGGKPEAPTLERSWIFSQWIDPAELAAVTVDGVRYPME